MSRPPAPFRGAGTGTGSPPEAEKVIDPYDDTLVFQLTGGQPQQPDLCVNRESLLVLPNRFVFGKPQVCQPELP